MANLLDQMIEQISREKHIEPEIIVSAIEDAMVVAARKYYKTEEDLRAKFNPETGQVDVYSVRTVVDEVTDPKKEITLAEARKSNPQTEVGGELLTAKPTAVLGRIAAQTATQVIMQKVRVAERDTIYNEYNGRVGELVNCIVKRFEGPDVIVDLGRTEARLPKREQSRLETYNLGDRLRVVIRAVDRAAKGPQVIVSRADPVLVQRLFEMEVPEIYDGTVQIRAAAREAGERTKIAVQSRDKDVDPVGACVGMKGMRVQSIIRELRGEKIDIIPYSEDTVTFAQKALSPAKVTRVQIIDPENRHLEIIVEDTQLSLAIGKKGQNVRLASKLIGWNVDIKSEEEKRQEIEAQMAALTAPGTPLSELQGMGPKTGREDRGARHQFDRAAGRYDAVAIDGNSGHRRKNGGEDSGLRRGPLPVARQSAGCRRGSLGSTRSGAESPEAPAEEAAAEESAAACHRSEYRANPPSRAGRRAGYRRSGGSRKPPAKPAVKRKKNRLLRGR